METAPQVIDRREALRRAAFLLGGAISAPTLAGVLAGCERASKGTKEVAAYKASTLATPQMETVASLGEHILPQTDTPGARAARVHEFIDAMLTDYYPDEERQRFLAGLGRLEQRVRRAHQRSFLELTAPQQREIVQALNQASQREPAAPGPQALATDPVLRDTKVEAARGDPHEAVAAPSHGVTLDDEWDPADVGKESFFRTLKELVLVGYYTSEIGQTQELRVNPMGVYRGDIPFSEIDRAWA